MLELFLSFQSLDHPLEVLVAAHFYFLHENIVPLKLIAQDGLVAALLLVLDGVPLEEVQLGHLKQGY